MNKTEVIAWNDGKVSRKVNFRQGSQDLLTPKELKQVAKNIPYTDSDYWYDENDHENYSATTHSLFKTLNETREQFGEDHPKSVIAYHKFIKSYNKDMGLDTQDALEDSYLFQRGGSAWDASGECHNSASHANFYLPHGTKMVKMIKYKPMEPGGKFYEDHYVNVVPTTEGPHVVDFTHRQFQGTAAFPVVQHIDDFMSRASMKNYILDSIKLGRDLNINNEK